MKRLLPFLLAILAAVIPALADDPAKPLRTVPDDEEDPYYLLCEEADRAIAAADYETAATRLLEALSLHPNFEGNILLLSNLGMVYSCLDRDSLAISTFDEALSRAPGQRTVLNNRARVLLKMGRDDEAYDDFETIIEADSINLDARFYHGTMALFTGDLATAEADFAVLRNIAPESTATAEALSALYTLTGRDAEAVPYLRRLIALDPSGEYYASLAGCYLQLERFNDASETIELGLAHYPRDPELYYYRARLKKERYLFDEAHADADRAVALGLSPRKAAELFK
ncbi:MAG: hypothetical protein HDS72_10430 [Bacteroidales bacterium]|nr:hypothetical protein [Bacteroidales bacterium]